MIYISNDLYWIHTGNKRILEASDTFNINFWNFNYATGTMWTKLLKT